MAAGEGRRLEPLTNRRPKPMIPVGNQPVLEYVVEAVADAGIDDIVLVVGYKRDRIQTYFGDGNDWGVDVSYAVQEKQLGTGHAVLQAEPHVDGAFVVLNGDRIIEPGVVEQVIDAPREAGDAVMAVTRSKRPGDYGVVTTDGDRATDIAEKPGPHGSASEIINAGVYGFDDSVFAAIRACDVGPDGELAITSALDRLISRATVRCVRYRGQWVDLTHLWDVVSVNASVLDWFGAGIAETATVESGAVVADAVDVGGDARIGANAALRPNVTLGDNVVVGSNAVLSNAVVFPGAVIDDGAVVRDAVVGEDARVGPNTTVVGGDADVVVDGTYHEGVTFGGVLGDYADVGGGVLVEPGTRLGDDAIVESGATLTGAISPETEVRRG